MTEQAHARASRPAAENVSALPAPADRWRPTRAGLVALWRYWDETFTFHRGRLLLRGPNGAGKSMALELLLPFLLDADASPARLSSAAKSRGGLFERVMTGSDDTSRTGFAWLELARGSEVFTVGARMRASHATRKVDLDFFTTTMAIGRDLHLLDADRVPLSRKALTAAIGETGRVHGSAEEHRAAVRAVLFPGFGADRFASLIGALLALRREKLSQSLVNVVELSRVLSEALPPIDDHDVAAVAEGFERLDRRHAELDGLDKELGVVRQLAQRQQDYARAVVVGEARSVRSAETHRDDVTREERGSREELSGAEEAARANAAQHDAVEERARAAGVEIDALKDSDAYRAGAALTDLRAQAARLRELATREGRVAGERAERRAAVLAELDAATGAESAAALNLELARRDLHGAGDAIEGRGLIEEAEGIDDADDAERLFHAWVRSRRELVASVRSTLDAYDRATERRQFVESQVAADQGAADEARSARRAALGAVTAAVERYRLAVGDWAARCEALGSERVRAALPSPPDDPGPVAAAVAGLAARAQAEDAVARRDLAARREALLAERDVLDAERSLLMEGGLPDPEAPPWRSDRAGIAGAPLWHLVDVATGVPDGAVDGIEAALGGAGLLDAWVQPDGAVDLGPDRADVVLGVRPVAGRSLASLLVPAGAAGGEAGVASGVVAAVLGSIAVPSGVVAAGPHEVLVATDGSYRLGSAFGRGPQRRARLLGAVARERHRLERLEGLDAALAALEVRLAEAGRQEGDLDRRRAAVDAELAALPDPAAVDDARQAASEAAARLSEAERRLDSSRAELRAAEEAVRAALRELTALGARHGLPTDREALKTIEAALERLERAVIAWARRRRDLAAAKTHLLGAVDRATRAQEEAERAEAEHATAEREAADVEGRVVALESSIGAELGELAGRIHGLVREQEESRRHARELAERMPALQRRIGELETRVEAAAAQRARAEEDRDQAHRRLVAAADALGTDAGIVVSGALESGSAVLSFARGVAAEHAGVDTGAQNVERLSERVREQVHQARTTLGGHADLARELSTEGWWALRIVGGGMRRRATELAGALSSELDQGRAELVAEEEQLFEQTLAGSVRRALAERIRQANAFLDAINDQLRAVRSAAGGVQVRLRWEVDPDQLDAVKAARSLLLRDPAGLSAPERESLQAFVRARVDQARAELEAGASWEARLRETLDYRAWHRFSLQLAHRDWDGFQPATPRRLQRLSTGERSIVLHLPMIASLAAHYCGEDGRPSGCPRLILLDELFAGVDSANRAQLFGTFSDWDLDAVFTSDHEWCQYATLDGIAIHHLHPPAGTDPVTSTRFTWDGRHRRIDPGGP